MTKFLMINALKWAAFRFPMHGWMDAIFCDDIQISDTAWMLFNEIFCDDIQISDAGLTSGSRNVPR